MNKAVQRVFMATLLVTALLGGCKKEVPPTASAVTKLKASLQEITPTEASEAKQTVTETLAEVKTTAGFEGDLAVLTRGNHRLAGLKDGSLRAARYVESRLKALGVKEVFTQDVPVVQAMQDNATMTVAGKAHRIYAMRPNNIQAAVTPPGGITAETLYVGDGTMASYGYADPANRIVLMDYDSSNRWKQAFSLGAKAVVFVGNEDPSIPSRSGEHYVQMPANLPRFYISHALAKELNLLKKGKASTKVTLTASARWKPLLARNVIAVIRGTDPRQLEGLTDEKEIAEAKKQQDQAVVLAAPLDSYSSVPLLAPGARDAANVAGLLSLVEHFVAHPSERDIIICFFDAQTQCQQGARAFYGALFQDAKLADHSLDEIIASLTAEKLFYRALLAILSEPQLFTIDFDALATKPMADGKPLGVDAEYLRTVYDRVMRPGGQLWTKTRLQASAVADELQTMRLVRYRLKREEVPLKLEIKTIEQSREDLDEQANTDDTKLRALALQSIKQSDQRLAEIKERLESNEKQWQELGEPIQSLALEDKLWNEIQRVLHERLDILGNTPEVAATLAHLYRYESKTKMCEDGRSEYDFAVAETPKRFAHLLHLCQSFSRDRIQSLDGELSRAWQAKTLQVAVGPERNFIALHLSLNLGDVRNKWTFIHGEDSNLLELDPVNNYNHVFRILDGFSQQESVPKSFDARPVSPRYSAMNHLFASAPHADSSAAARLFHIYNLSLMTVMDPMERQGQPCDGVAELNVQNMQKQIAAATPIVANLANAPGLRIQRKKVPKPLYITRFWENGTSTGSNIKRYGAGSARADLPVGNATVSINSHANKVWGHKIVPGQVSALVVQADSEGHLSYGPLGPKQFGGVHMVAATFDKPAVTADGEDPYAGSVGLITMMTNTQSTSSGGGGKNHRLELFKAKNLTFVDFAARDIVGKTLTMSARSTAAFRKDRTFLAEHGGVLSLYAPQEDRAVKLFNEAGMVILNNTPTRKGHTGEGQSLSNPFFHPSTPLMTAHDLQTLNQYRLDLLRVNQIRQDSLASLNGRSKDIYEDIMASEVAVDTDSPTDNAKRMTLDERTGKAEQAASLARNAYRPLVAVMNDLVTAVVLLLLLAIPFAYALERLFIGTPHIYRQIAWFAGFFLLTFGILFLVNPAFKIAATPIIIFLAFTIILLSGLVMFIVIRKLQVEIKRMQGLASTVHSADVSRLSTMMAAVNMGISTMRRRALRTTLTATTVILLTFTILTFASFGSSWGAQKTFVSPMSGPNRMVTRHQLWNDIPTGTFDAIRGAMSDQAVVVPRYWVSPTAKEAQTAQAAGRDLDTLITDAQMKELGQLSATIGLDRRDIERQPALARLLDGQVELLDSNGIFLTEAVAKRLNLTREDIGTKTLLMWSQELTFAGYISDRMAAHLMLDESKMLPVNYAASAEGSDLNEMSSAGADLAEQPDADSAQFVEYNVDMCCVVGTGTAMRNGGAIRMITTYPLDAQDTEAIATQLAEMVPMPTYYGSQGGVYRTIFRSLTHASGWKDLLIPVLLGGLIVFATMLGSVSDREQEIYTFSSLGLAPMHVGGLFFAEAGVYAVVGGMGGYLLGQIVARLLSILAGYGIISVPSMNYSSTNAIVTVMIVMGTVLISTIWPAIKASKSANPGIQRAWRIGTPAGSLYDIVFPFTVSAYDITGVVSFLHEHFENSTDSASGTFATQACHVFRQEGSDMLGYYADVALVPYDLGVTQRFALLSKPSEIEGINEVRILIRRMSGTLGDWRRGNRVFVDDLRKQLLIWRSLPPEVMDKYRQLTLDTWSQLPLEQHTPESMGGEA